MVQRIKSFESGVARKESSLDYKDVSVFAVVTIGDSEKLVKRPATDEVNMDDLEVYIDTDQMYDMLLKIHAETGHGGRDRMLQKIKDLKVANINRELIEGFLKLCSTCVKNKPVPRAGVVVKPIITEKFGERIQADVIDYQSCPDDGYKFVLNIQDHHTKFCILRPLASKAAIVVAKNIMEMFCIFGPPTILQSDNGGEFVNATIKQLKTFWPGLTLVNGKPRKPTSQGSVERCNGDVENMLKKHMVDHETTKWAAALPRIMFLKNTALNRGIGMSPYEMMFGKAYKSNNLPGIPQEFYDRLLTEDDLARLVKVEEEDDEIVDVDVDVWSSVEVLVEDDNRIDDEEPEQMTSSESKRREQLAKTRANGVAATKRQAEAMVNRSRKKMKTDNITVGTNIRVRIPEYDRSKADLMNILGVVGRIMDIKKGGIIVWTEHGALDGTFYANEYVVEDEKHLTLKEVKASPKLTVRQCARLLSVVGGQGMTRCECTAASRCLTQRCNCVKNNMKCNSRCHNSGTCKNK
jgi:hypothetical protein